MKINLTRSVLFAAACGLCLAAGCTANRVESSNASVSAKADCAKGDSCCSSAKSCDSAAKSECSSKN